MRLFHITCLAHFQKIWKEDQYLKTVESNIGSPENLKYDATDDTYERDMVPIWEEPVRPFIGKTPTLVPGAVLKQMEEANGKHQYVRATREHFASFDDAADALDTMKVKLIVGADLDPGIHPEAHFGDHVGPDVVWLTSDPTPTQSWAGTERIPEDLFMYSKDEILFVVDVPDGEVFTWHEFAFEEGINEVWFDMLDSVDQVTGRRHSDDWYVISRPVPKIEWDSIYMAKSGKVMWLNPEKYPDVSPEHYVASSGLIDPEREPEITARYPAPQVYKTAQLRRSI